MTVPPAPAVSERREVDIGTLKGFLASIGSRVGPEMILSPQKPLFHYTTLDGVLNILKGDDLWLTDSRYSNDAEEMTHGVRIAGEVLAELRNEGQTPVPYLDRIQRLLEQQMPQGVYICCFCAEDNVLSQWRGYGANGAGVSIELASEGFANVTGVDSPFGLLWLWPVTYLEPKQKDIIRSAIAAYATDADLERAAQCAVDAIQFFVPTFKNKDFKDENERRLIFTPYPNCAVPVQHRVARGMLVPYYGLRAISGLPPQAAFPQPRAANMLPVRGLTVGPSANKDLIVRAATPLFVQHGYGNVPVRASKTSYRG